MGVLRFFGGLAFFLYGMYVMGKGLTKLSGGRLEGVLARMCRTPWRGVLFGALVTAAIQSSSATTVMVVGFVNAGLMTLSHAVGVIMGANLGTTVTAWILSLVGVSGDAPLLVLLKPASLSPMLAVVGTLLLLLSRRERPRELGAGLVGFALLFAGMEAMSGAISPLAQHPAFARALIFFENPLAGLLAGALLTALIQSSSASVGILQAMCATGAIRVGMAVPIIMGQNIGTCITALLSSVGAGKNAKRAAFIHLYFNLGGTVALLALFYLLSFLGPLSSDATASEATVAFIHTAFNVGATALWLPLSGQLVQLATHTVREGGKAPQKADGGGLPAVREEYTLLDERFLNAPAVALEVAGAAFSRMCEMAFGEFLLALLQCGEYEDMRQAEITRCEALWRRYERSLSSYLVKLSSVKMHASAAAEVSRLLLLLPDITRVGERAAGIAAGAGKRKRDAVPLSHAAVKELAVLRDAVDELTAHTKAALFDGERGEASRVWALADVLSRICADLRRRHVARLREGNCHTDAARIFASWICDVESFCDHCKRLAAPAAQENALHGGKDTRRAHAEFSEKYRLQE